MSDKTTGLYAKFTVRRTDGRDGPGEKHEHCRYFVLDLDDDPLAYPALAAYARAAKGAGYYALARDLAKVLRHNGAAPSPEFASPMGVCDRCGLPGGSGGASLLNLGTGSLCHKELWDCIRALVTELGYVKMKQETAALDAMEGKRLQQGAAKIESQQAQYAHLALKHDALERRLATVRAQVEALPTHARQVCQALGYGVEVPTVDRAAVLALLRKETGT